MPNDADRAGTPAGVFGAELRFYRTRPGLSQKDLAALVHVSNDVISKIETGERPPAEDFPPRLDAIPELDTRGALTRLWDHLKKGPEATPIRLVPGVGRHRSPGHGPALVRAARRPRPAPDRGLRPSHPQRPPRRQPVRPRRAGSCEIGPASSTGPNGRTPALVHPRRRRPTPRHRRHQGNAKPALPPSRGGGAPQDHDPGHQGWWRPRWPAGALRHRGPRRQAARGLPGDGGGRAGHRQLLGGSSCRSLVR
jgi:transcriptional regulator with XRE-family HTH domain